MHYLTVQDVLWIHLQIAKKAVKFNYAKLEEAVSYQYAYGKSKDVVSQAARFFSGFPAMSPFDSDNQAAGYIAGIAFLQLNGYELTSAPQDVLQWCEGASTKTKSLEMIQTGTRKFEHGHHLTPKEVAGIVLATYLPAITKHAIS